MKPKPHSIGAIQVLSEVNAALLSSRKVKPSEIAYLSESSFIHDMESAARGLWRATSDMTMFLNRMFAIIETEYTRAWRAGMIDAGVNPRDMSEDEKTALGLHISSAQGKVYDLGLFIQEHSRANEYEFGSLEGRLDLWLTGYNTVYNDALTFASSDPNLVWVLGGTEQHCTSCNKLNGKVKRASVWDASMLQPSDPPNFYLECGGWRCRCYFEVTSSVQSRGPLPTLAIRPTDWMPTYGHKE